jgi:FkbM family methyltransferase
MLYEAKGLEFYVRSDADKRVVDEIVNRQSYLRPRLGFSLLHNEKWLDLGANIGAFGVWATKTFNAQIYSVEPIAENVTLLRENFRRNNFNSIIDECAVGTCNGFVDIAFSPNTPARSTILKHNNNSRRVRQRAFRSVLDAFQPDGLKIDIEGAEFAILEQTFPVSGIRAIALEYHFRFDKSCINARRRIEFLLKEFPHHSIHSYVFSKNVWSGWQDDLMLFWR